VRQRDRESETQSRLTDWPRKRESQTYERRKSLTENGGEKEKEKKE